MPASWATMERKALQFTVTALSLVPLGAGLLGAVQGLHVSVGSMLDSHYRYLSGLLITIGLLYLRLVPAIERKQLEMQLLTTIVVGGGIVRALSSLRSGHFSAVVIFALAMELGVAPLLML